MGSEICIRDRAKLSESVIYTKQHIIGAYLSEISQIFLALPTIFIQMSCQVSDLDPVVHTLTDDAMLPRVVAPIAVSTATIATGLNVCASQIPTHNAREQRQIVEGFTKLNKISGSICTVSHDFVTFNG